MSPKSPNKFLEDPTSPASVLLELGYIIDEMERKKYERARDEAASQRRAQWLERETLEGNTFSEKIAARMKEKFGVPAPNSQASTAVHETSTPTSHAVSETASGTHVPINTDTLIVDANDAPPDTPGETLVPPITDTDSTPE